MSLGKFSHAGPTDGMACRFNGRWGRYRNAVCIDVSRSFVPLTPGKRLTFRPTLTSLFAVSMAVMG